MMSDAGIRHSRQKILRTYLIIHDGIMDVSSKATKLICILDIAKKACNLALLYQWFQLL